MSVPFGERGGWLRGCLDLACGRFPRFVFGGSTAGILPIFHFHNETRQELEPRLRYLAENGYQTVVADDVAQIACGQRPPREREVALCFDDAWAEVWTDAAPLLKSLGLRAIVYAIPGRTQDADACRPIAGSPASGLSPFMTWPELKALHAAGTIDVQSHTYTHASIFTSDRVVGFVQPGYAEMSILNRPLLSDGTAPAFVEPNDLGAPLFEQRSRMSDGRRARVAMEIHQSCVRLVATEGGAAFFQRSGWEERLRTLTSRAEAETTFETEAEQQQAIESELDRARSELNARLSTQSVQHVCLPWGVSGDRTAAALKKLGFRSAIANRQSGTFAVSPGDDPFWLKRLPNRYIYRLPGRSRRWWFAA
jgi:hypothetical protein